MTIASDVQLGCGPARAVVCPADGLVVSSFSVGSRQILFPDGWIDANGKKKRRGGIPILFPQAGALAESQPDFRLSQHGFARDMKWETRRISKDGCQAEFLLSSNDDTRSQYPFDFEVHATLGLEPSALCYGLVISNPSNSAIWTAPGLHPYFAIPSTRRLELETNVFAFQIGAYRMDESLILPPQRVDLVIPEIGQVSMIPGGDFLRTASRLVVWSDRSEYMCFEPWAAGVGSLFRQDERLEILPGKEARMSMRIEVR